MGKSRAEIRPALSFQFEIVHVCPKLFFIRDLLIRLHGVITLDNVDIHFPEKAVLLT